MNVKQGILILALIFALAAQTLAADFIVVVHAGNALSRMAEQDVKQIFLGKKTTWPNGRTIDIIIQEDTDAHAGFTQEILGKTSQQFMIYWKKMLFTGKVRQERRGSEGLCCIKSRHDRLYLARCPRQYR
jgi:hypothetical protein